MMDLHNHLIPGVDDGAASVAEATAALRLMWKQGVGTVLVTPHVDGSLTASPARLERRMAEIDAGWELLREIAGVHFPELRLERGAELMLDTPAPDLSDPRVRLAGSRAVLVEFTGFMVPPNAGEALRQLVELGTLPVIAHPERYEAVQGSPHLVQEWVDLGCRLQVNCGSLLGRYGDAARLAAFALLREGCASYLASDYHGRGRLAIQECEGLLVRLGGAEQLSLLLDHNPHRLLSDEPPLPVPPLELRRSWWQRVRETFSRPEPR